MSDEQKEVKIEEEKKVEQQAQKPRQQREKKPKKEKQPPPQKKEKGSIRSELLGVGADKDTEFGKWYTNVVRRAELIENYDVSGCYILRPDAYAIWEVIQATLDGFIKESGVKNAYFPLLVTKAALHKEETHVQGFSPEVAWVTKSGDSQLENPVAIRPTSETIIYPAVAKWISSYRDLPLRLNQWTNIVRWEFKDAVPFIRSREFLWQEGHSAFATQEEADAEVMEILRYYQRVYEDVLAVPVFPGRKSEKEKFAGADYTTTVEAFLPSIGRAVQGATSHCLGQNFSKMFEISFLNEGGKPTHPFQNSWGFTTRSIGVMIMTHGDNKGLVLPPRAAPIQVVIIPLHFKGTDTEAVDSAAEKISQDLKKAGVRVFVDKSPHNPGYKFNHWEMRGIPLKLELGPKDLAAGQVVASRRDKSEKADKIVISNDDIVEKVKELLDDLHQSLFNKAKEAVLAHRITVKEWKDFVPALNQKNCVLAPWCDVEECENQIKKKSAEESVIADNEEEEVGHRLSGAAKSLCKPFDQPEEGVEGLPCFNCGKPAKTWCLFGRSY